MRDFPYIYRWDRHERKDQPCRVLARGKMNSCLVELPDGYRMVTSRKRDRQSGWLGFEQHAVPSVAGPHLRQLKSGLAPLSVVRRDRHRRRLAGRNRARHLKFRTVLLVGFPRQFALG